jgi:transcriptional regulator with XRE-family HTH domain
VPIEIGPEVTAYVRELVEQEKAREPTLSYNKLAERIGVTTDTMSKLKNGKGGVGGETLPRYAKHFRMTVPALIAAAKARARGEAQGRIGRIADVRFALLRRHPEARAAVDAAVNEYVDTLPVDLVQAVLDVDEILKPRLKSGRKRGVDKGAHAKQLSEPPDSVPRDGARE